MVQQVVWQGRQFGRVSGMVGQVVWYSRQYGRVGGLAGQVVWQAPCSNCTCDPYGMFPQIFQLILFILVYLKLCVKFGKYLTRDFGIIRILNFYLMKIYKNFSQISVFLDVYRPFVLKIWRIPPYYYIFSERYYLGLSHYEVQI